MKTGTFGGFLTGTALSALVLGGASILTYEPPAAPSAPDAADVNVPAGSEFRQSREDTEATLPGSDDIPDPADTQEIEAPEPDDIASLDVATSAPTAQPTTGAAEPDLNAPDASDASSGVDLDLEEPVLASPQTLAPQAPTDETDLSISKDPAQPVLPETPEGSAFDDEVQATLVPETPDAPEVQTDAAPEGQPEGQAVTVPEVEADTAPDIQADVTDPAPEAPEPEDEPVVDEAATRTVEEDPEVAEQETAEEGEIAEQGVTEEESEVAEQVTAEEDPKVAEQGTTEEDPEVAEQGTTEEDPEVAEQGTTEEDPEVAEQGTTEEDPEVAEQGTTEEDPEVAEQGTTEEDPEIAEQGKTEEDPEVAEQGTTEEDPEVAEPGTTEEDPEVAEQETTEDDTGVASLIETEAGGQPEVAGTIGNLAQGVTVGRLPSVTGSDAASEESDAEQLPDVTPEGPSEPLEQYSAVFDNPEGKPLMSFVLLDQGDSPISYSALADFPYPISYAVDVTWSGAEDAMARYRAAGLEVLAMIDLPEGAGAVDTEVAMQTYLAALPETVAVMEGVRTGLQSNREATEQLIPILQESGHGLVLFSEGFDTAQKLISREGVPALSVFRDIDSKDQTAAVIRRFLDQAAFRAGQEDVGVIIVGRLRAETVSALLLWGLQDRANSVAIAPVSALLKAQVEE